MHFWGRGVKVSKGGKRGGKVLISGDITLNGVGYSLQGSDHAVGGNCK